MRRHHENIIAIGPVNHAKHAVSEFGNDFILAAQGRVGHILHDAIRRGERSLNVGKQDTASLHLIGRVLAELYHCRSTMHAAALLDRGLG